MFNFAGKIALITGAGGGNGAAIAKGLASHGATVVVSDVDYDNASKIMEEIKAAGGQGRAIRLDVTQCDGNPDFLGALDGGLDILVNNAGILLRGTIFSDDALPAWQRTLDVNLNGAFNVTRLCLPAIKQRQGNIVNVASVQSFIHLEGSSVAYTASKGALAAFTRALAVELGPAGVRVNAVAPGIIETPLNEASRRDNPSRAATLASAVPLGRWGVPADVVGPVCFLASDAADYVTGVVMPVDGGRLAA